MFISKKETKGKRNIPFNRERCAIGTSKVKENEVKVIVFQNKILYFMAVLNQSKFMLSLK